MRSLAIRLFLAALIITNFTFAQAPVPVGNAVLVNEWTTASTWEPRIDLAPDGSGAITWWGFTFSSSLDGDGYWVSTRRIDTSGAPIGQELLVNVYTTGDQAISKVSVAENGSFVVAWRSTGQVDGRDVFTRVYASDGSPLSGELLANNTTVGYQENPVVGHQPGDGFVVVWAATQEAAVQAQRFDSNGVKLGSQFDVEANASGTPDLDISVIENGDFVAVWENGSVAAGVTARRFASSGAALGASFLVSSYTSGTTHSPSVEYLADGGFVVIWDSDLAPGQDLGRSVRGRVFAADGSPQGGEFQANGFTTGSQYRSHVTAADNGDFVVVWEESRYPARNGLRGDPRIDSIKGRIFQASGAPISDDFDVVSGLGLSVSFADVAAAPGGRFAVVWADYDAPGDTDRAGVVLQWYQNQHVFSDDLESGTTAVWSLSTP